MRLLRIKKGKNVPHLKIVLSFRKSSICPLQCCKQIFSTEIKSFAYICPNKSFGQLLDILPKKYVF